MPKVTVCVPVYNVEQYIGRCIESILNQTLQDIEIIIVNDCTPDNSMQIVREYATKDSRIKIIEHEANHGLMWARRTGYMAASGYYITFCDSDDSLPLDSCEQLYKKAVESDADIVAGSLLYVLNDNRKILKRSVLKYGEDAEGVYHSLLDRDCGHNLCSKLFKSSILKEHSYDTFDNFVNGEDAVLLYEVIANIKKMVTIEDIVYYYYSNMESSSKNATSAKALKNMFMALAVQYKQASQYYNLNNIMLKYFYRAFVDIRNGGVDYSKIKKLARQYDLPISFNPLHVLKICGSYSVKYMYRMYK